MHPYDHNGQPRQHPLRSRSACLLLPSHRRRCVDLAAAKAIYTFLRSENSHNLKYMGLDALGGIVSINPRQAQEHQTAVMDCLEDPDDTLKLKTLELLYKMTTASNVEVCVLTSLGYASKNGVRCVRRLFRSCFSICMRVRMNIRCTTSVRK